MISNKRIARNTLVLYLRMLLTTGVSLYTVRVVLSSLGTEDYGLYNVVGGIVALLAFLPGAMSSATQRFFSFALGQGDRGKLKRIFTVNCAVYAALGGIALILFETVGLWFVSGIVKIPSDRFDAALTLYHLSVWTFIFGIITSPFRAIITAHEDMHVHAIISILEAVLKLGAVLLLSVTPGNKLEFYGALVLASSVIVAGIYLVVCAKRYEECQFRRFYWDSALLREVVGFTTWTLFGQLTTVARSQAVTILINQVFSPVVVAARAVAVNVAAQVNVFSGNFNTSLYPPIIKSYAAGDQKGMHALIFNGSKITFFLMWILALPILLEMDAILAFWLKDPPVGAALFTRLALVEALVSAVSLPLMTAARAPGKMALYESVLGAIQILIFLVSWLVLKMGGAPYSVFVVAIAANVVMFLFRFGLVRRLIGISTRQFIRKVILPIGGVAFLSTALSLIVGRYLQGGVLAASVSVLLSMLFASACIYILGLDREWRYKARAIIKSRILKFS